MCTFKSYNSLKIHLTRFHPEKQETHGCEKSREFHCPLCTLKLLFVEQDMFCHLQSHLKKFEMVTCPYRNCNFQTNNHSTFNSHKWRKHHNALEYNDMMVKSEVSEQQNSGSEDEVSESHSVLEPTALDTSQLFDKLQPDLAAFFLKLQTVLHVSERAVQEIVKQLDQLVHLSQPLIKVAVSKVLAENQCCVPESVVDEIVEAVSENNVHDL